MVLQPIREGVPASVELSPGFGEKSGPQSGRPEVHGPYCVRGQRPDQLWKSLQKQVEATEASVDATHEPRGAYKKPRDVGSLVRAVTSLQQSSEDAMDMYGRKFPVPVDSEHKSLNFKLLSFSRPHMRAFHLSWMCFFMSFFTAFAPAPLLPIIREDLSLTEAQVAASGIATVTGTIFGRVLLGALCDVIGPRYGNAITVLGTAPAVFCLAVVRDSTGFTLARLVMGVALSTFVTNQYWCSSMFSTRIVGVANATAAGWGNLGGGVTQLAMPLLVVAISLSVPSFVAWRWAFLVIGCIHCLVGFCILLFTQDVPDGQMALVRAAGVLPPIDLKRSSKAALGNYRTYLLTIVYCCSFGVELTITDIVTSYFFDQFNVTLPVAGVLGASFGIMNLFARSLGGWMSDTSTRLAGMRGRLWCLYACQMALGVFCTIIGFVSNSLVLTIIFLVLFSIATQAAEGAVFGIVPFVTRRGLGAASGVIGAGGSLGSVIIQSVVYFVTWGENPANRFVVIGILVLLLSQVVVFIKFPMWGGMVAAPDPEAREMDYYKAAYSARERQAGLHRAVEAFAREAAATERGPSARQQQTNAYPQGSASSPDLAGMDQSSEADTTGHSGTAFLDSVNISTQ